MPIFSYFDKAILKESYPKKHELSPYKQCLKIQSANESINNMYFLKINLW